MAVRKHMILKQVLDVTIANRSRAMAIQEQVSGLVRNKLNPAIDTSFSSLCQENEILRIDKLEVDLGVISEKELETGFHERAQFEIEAKIRELLQAKTSGAGKDTDMQQSNFPQGVEMTSEEKSVLEQFVFFLRFGYLQWNHPAEKGYTYSLIDNILNYDPALIRTAVLPVFREKDVRKRMLLQFEKGRVIKLLKIIDAERYIAFEKVLHALMQYSLPGAKIIAGKIRRLQLEMIMQEMAIGITEEERMDAGTFISRFLISLLEEMPVDEKQAVLITIFSNSILRSDFAEDQYSVIITEAVSDILSDESFARKGNLPDLISKIPEGHEKEIVALLELIARRRLTDPVKAKTSEEQALQKAIFKNSQPEPGGHDPPLKKKKLPDDIIFQQKSSPEAESIFINNAGLVLLHPFLKHFFKGLSLLDEKLNFNDMDDAIKAVHLLQYIATGEFQHEENELVLNKILCGIELSEPLPQKIGLNEEEILESEHLARTVLERWESLRTNNIDALRTTYILRDGILRESGKGWNLFIERNTYDVMLEKLPWSYSIIHLPWNPQILYVEW